MAEVRGDGDVDPEDESEASKPGLSPLILLKEKGNVTRVANGPPCAGLVASSSGFMTPLCLDSRCCLLEQRGIELRDAATIDWRKTGYSQ